jgi:L,D-peptidoglycan transpeptidase YkuD (ErfK/YbiS/YcfS/YnhG family)
MAASSLCCAPDRYTCRMIGGLAALVAGALVAMPAPESASAAPSGSQLIVVSARSHHATVATFTAYAIAGGVAHVALGPWRARLGYNGFARPGRKHEGDGRTPSGTFGFRFMFGIEPNPGVLFPYRPVRRYDFWDDDPASPLYNKWVNARRRSPGLNPEPMHRRPAYEYGVVIAYNTARVPGRGSAVFLHVDVGGPTGGCVSLPRSELLVVLRWLDPADAPRIELGVRAPAPPLAPTGQSGATGATGATVTASPLRLRP